MVITWGGIGFMHLDPENGSWGTTYTGEHFWIGGRLIDTPAQERSALVFATNNVTTAGSHSSEKMVILPNGNVGIGTSSPSESLEVLKDGGAIIRLHDPGNNSWKIKADSDFHIYDDSSSDYLTILNNSNVGIGTTSPEQKLDVRGDVQIHSGATATSVQELGFKNIYNTALLKASYTNPSQTTETYLAFHTNTSGASNGTVAEQMRIAGDKVGIGTTSPAGKLAIKSPGDVDTYGDAFVLERAGTTAKLIRMYEDAADGFLELRTGTDAIVTKLSGYSGTASYLLSNVGIGTASPNAKLHVSDSGSTTSVFIGNTGSGVSRAYLDASNGDFSGSDYMWIGQNNDLSGEIVMTQNAGSFHIKTQPSGTLTSQLSVSQNGTITLGSYGAGILKTNASGVVSLDTNTYSTASGVEDNADVTDTANVVAALTAGTNVQIAADGTISATDTDTVYSHPTFNGDDFSIDTGALSGYTVVSDIDINVTTNSEGHVTDANGSVNTRNISNLRIVDTRTGEITPNDYRDHALSLDFTDEFGSLGAWYSGITLKGWSDGYAAWQLIGNSTNNTNDQNLYYRTGTSTTWGTMHKVYHSGNLTAGTNVSISSGGVISATNTTYTVGDGGLTQKNFTTTLKNKLDGIAASATNVTNNNQLTNGAGYLTSSSTQSKYLRSDTADTASELITFSKGISSDGNSKFYNWRALNNSSNSGNSYWKIADISGADQSSRFIVTLAGRSTSYSNEALPAMGHIVGQLNNDNNWI